MNKCDYQGLSEVEVITQAKLGNTNEFEHKTDKTIKDIIIKNTFNLFNGLNLLIALLVLITGKYQNMLFFIVVISNSLIAIYQEIKAKILLDKLKDKNKPKAKVIRENKEEIINSDDIVLNDLISLNIGDSILCDGKILQGELIINEAIITGETKSIKKKIGDDILAGSFIISGNAYVKATAVGNNNYINKVIKKISESKVQPSKIRDSLNMIIKYISIIIIPLSSILFIKFYFFQDHSLNDSLLQTSANMIGMIPEGLILLTSISLYTGAIKLAQQKTLVNELYSIETLAHVDTLCLDKTGTLTTGKMNVRELINIDNNDYYNIIANIVHQLDDQNQTALALKDYFKITSKLKISDKQNFSSETKTSFARIDKTNYYLGAYEFSKITDSKIEKMISSYSKQGFRIICLNDDFKIKALILITDELRKGIEKTLNYFKKQNVEIKIISGDNPETVKFIAEKCGLNVGNNYLDLSKSKIQDSIVYGRVNPDQKETIINHLKTKGHTVAMVGDGVNDVLALKEADFSIAIENGVDATKNIANIILMDNDFSHLNQVVNEGRRIINNITVSATLFLVKTALSISLGILSILLFKSYPFIPIQLTIISSFGIGIPSFILSFEPNYKKVESAFLSTVLKKAIPYGVTTALSVALINILSNLNLIDNNLINTIIFIMTAVTFLVISFDIFKPFNLLKSIVLVFNIAGLLIAYFIFNQYLSLIHLDLNSIIITIILILTNLFIAYLIKQSNLLKIINKKLAKY